MPSSSVKHRAACGEGNTWGHSRLRAAQSAGSAGPFSSLSRHSYVLAMLIQFCEGLWNQELMLHEREASLLRRAAVWWGLAVVALRTERASLNFRHILPPSNRSLCSMTDSFLSFIFWWKWTSEMVEGQGTVFLFPVYHFHLPYAPWFLCSHFFSIFFILVLNYICLFTALVAIIFSNLE